MEAGLEAIYKHLVEIKRKYLLVEILHEKK